MREASILPSPESLPLVAAAAAAAGDRQPQQPPLTGVVHPQQTRDHLTVQGEVALLAVKAGVGRPAPEGEVAARGIRSPGQGEVGAQQQVLTAHGIGRRGRMVDRLRQGVSHIAGGGGVAHHFAPSSAEGQVGQLLPGQAAAQPWRPLSGDAVGDGIQRMIRHRPAKPPQPRRRDGVGVRDGAGALDVSRRRVELKG